MSRQVEGKVVLVTGASSGMGRASAVAFAREGAKVVVADVNVEGGKETVNMIRKAGGDAIFIKTDVSRATEVEALVNNTVKTYGRLDCAHNNAGVAGPAGNVADCTEENWDRLISINLKGVWLCMKYEIIHMVKHGGGAIVNTGSIAGLTGVASRIAYVASKHGVIGLTKAAAVGYAKAGIRVNAVCPGCMQTPMFEETTGGDPEVVAVRCARIPIGRIATPEEVAQVVVWLCSDASSYITGDAMSVDGGWAAGEQLANKSNCAAVPR